MLSRSTLILNLALTSVIVAACQPGAESTATDSEGDDSSASSSSSTTETSTLDPSTGPSSDPTMGDTTDAPEFPLCPASDPAVEVAVSVESQLITEKSEFDVECEVQSSKVGELALQCTDEGVAHDVVVKFSGPQQTIITGHDKVRLRYRMATQLGIEERLHVSLRGLENDGLLLFYAQGYDVFAAEFAAFWAPLQLADGPLGLCPVEGDCFTSERSVILVGEGEQQLQIADHGANQTAGLWIFVEQAFESVPNANGECPNDAVAGRRVELLALDTGLD